MKRYIPGLRQAAHNGNDLLEGVFLVRVDRAFYRWHPQKPFFVLRLAVLEPKEHTGQIISGRLYCTPRALWRLNWFFKSQLPVIKRALETAALMLGSGKSRSYCFEMICADFLAGAHLEGGNPDLLLMSLGRLFALLPPPQKQEFLEQLPTAS